MRVTRAAWRRCERLQDAGGRDSASLMSAGAIANCGSGLAMAPADSLRPAGRGGGGTCGCGRARGVCHRSVEGQMSCRRVIAARSPVVVWF